MIQAADRLTPDAVALSLFASRLVSVCDQMAGALKRSAFSPNIKERGDFSCAVFDADGQLSAQAAHIPVHLGSMAYAMADIVGAQDWAPGDQLIVNDPFLGGTHLPDVTLIAPVFVSSDLRGFVANRAHHADIGAESPGSMPLSQTLDEEGIVIAPTHLVRGGHLQEKVVTRLAGATRNPSGMRGDLSAQLSANRIGGGRLGALIEATGFDAFTRRLTALNDYAAQLAQSSIARVPDGCYEFTDFMDGDGLTDEEPAITVTITIEDGRAGVDFTGTTGEVRGNLNCPLPVTAAGVYYVFRCLMPPQTPACAGLMRAISLFVPAPCLLNAARPAAVAAGNVETSSRVVDVICGALAKAIPHAIPAASQGTMNNLAMGSGGESSWDYYETIGGGMGAGRNGGGLSAVQTHMTNTANTPVEVLEWLYPLRVRRYQVRRGSGGRAARDGGDGVVREFEFLRDAEISLLTERRRHAPWGLEGGQNGKAGRNCLNGAELPPKVARRVGKGDILTIETPGAGGWGKKNA